MASGERRLVLPAATTTPRRARHFVADALRELGVDVEEVHDAAAIVTSELVTNAVVYGDAVTVSVELVGAVVRIVVEDPSGLAPQRQSPPASAVSGRGIRIVEALAVAWGVDWDRPGPGKAVWADLDRRG